MTYIKIFLLFLSVGFFPTCTDAQPKTDGDKVLIVYLSRTNNTKVLAEIIQKQVGGTLVALELEKPYPENYKAIVEQVSKELNSGFLPPLKTKIEHIEQFDTVFIGFPTWAMQLPPPMQSFLHDYNFKGKTLIPFNTNAGYGIGNAFDKVKELCPEAHILEGFSMIGGKERDGIFLTIKGKKATKTEATVSEWLKRIGVQ